MNRKDSSQASRLAAPPAAASGAVLRIGNQTAFAAANFLDPFQYALANGFEAFEWFPDRKPTGAGWDETSLNSALRDELRQSAQAAGLRVSVHARWTANPLRPESYPILMLDLELAEALGASLLNLHLYTEAGVEAYAKSLLPFLQNAAERGLQVSIENTVETPPQAFNQLFGFLQKRYLGVMTNVGMCLDIGHANLCLATRNDYLGYLDQLEEHVPIIHLHLHENWGDADSHSPLFTGPAAADPRGILGLLRRLHTRAYAGSAILEQWPQPATLLNAARDRLRQIWSQVLSLPL